MKMVSDCWEGLNAEDLIEKMFERTDADGVLYMPSFFTGDNDDRESLRCVMSWELPGECCAVMEEFVSLREALDGIASVLGTGEDYSEEKNNLLSEKLFPVWNTYVRPFETEGFDLDRIRDIEERLAITEDVREVCGQISSGKEIDRISADFLRDCMDVSVSAEEKAFYEKYCDLVMDDARRRLGDRPFAYRTLIHARRYCRLITLEAPSIISEREAQALASALALYRYCRRFEYVDHAVRRHYDRLELMSEEELDALSRPKKANTRKSMAPLFVYLILAEHSDSEHPLTQQQILSYLADDPYEVVLERKALSRIIHNLKDSQVGVYTDKHRGTWHMGGAVTDQ